ncbi:hypothetical protein QBC47DRAFT_438502 [Echria macrotheca]|uniref:Uncharacterized protein n=1 Tax=Echria macrotheca TaxID=438768 RepID=A0AAJ0B3I9_9PEZI|nr:hypothetical protein QBC47DRAFT_438502 [Echria macrotheca]
MNTQGPWRGRGGGGRGGRGVWGGWGNQGGRGGRGGQGRGQNPTAQPVPVPQQPPAPIVQAVPAAPVVPVAQLAALTVAQQTPSAQAPPQAADEPEDDTETFRLLRDCDNSYKEIKHENMLILYQDIPERPKQPHNKVADYFQKVWPQISGPNPHVLKGAPIGKNKQRVSILTEDNAAQLMENLISELREGRQIIEQAQTDNWSFQPRNCADIPPERDDIYWEYICKWLDMRIRNMKDKTAYVRQAYLPQPPAWWPQPKLPLPLAALAAIDASPLGKAAIGNLKADKNISRRMAGSTFSPSSVRMSYLHIEAHSTDFVGDVIFLRNQALVRQRHGQLWVDFYNSAFVYQYAMGIETAEFIVRGSRTKHGQHFKDMIEFIDKGYAILDRHTHWLVNELPRTANVPGQPTHAEKARTEASWLFENFQTAMRAVGDEFERERTGRCGNDPAKLTDFRVIRKRADAVKAVIDKFETKHGNYTLWSDFRHIVMYQPFDGVKFMLHR